MVGDAATVVTTDQVQAEVYACGGARRGEDLARVHDRFLPTGLADATDPASTGPLRTATTRYQHALDTLAERCGLAA